MNGPYLTVRRSINLWMPHKDLSRHRETERLRRLHNPSVDARTKRWRIQNRERMLQSNRDWKERNAEKRIAKNLTWRRNNRLKIRIASHVRRTRMKGRFTEQDVYDLFVKQDWYCANPLCIVDLIFESYHIDHKIPVSLGGSNTKENIQLLCVDCNLQKRNRTDLGY